MTRTMAVPRPNAVTRTGGVMKCSFATQFTHAWAQPAAAMTDQTTCTNPAKAPTVIPSERGKVFFICGQYTPYASIYCTRPTSPDASRTLIPRGCTGALVRMSFTTPRVDIPFPWSCFSTITTVNPG